jgi:beta-lactamase class A
MDNLLADIQEMEKDFSGTLGVCAQRVDAVEQIAWQADEEFPAASVIKLPILVTCLRQVQEGSRSLDEKTFLQVEDQVIGSGILKELIPGLVLTLEDLLILMIAISDNTATNLVLDRVKPSEVNAYMASLGHGKTFSAGKLFSDTGGRLSTMTPRDMVNLLVQLANGRILTPSLCHKAIDILSKQQFTNLITRQLVYDPFNAEEGTTVAVKVASKSGAIRGVRNDVGLVTASGVTYAVALMSKDCADQRFHPDNEAALFLPRVSRRIYDYYTGRE